jgi:methyl-accepting chemotaxis protein
MRRGVSTISRALVEQSTAGSQISQESQRLSNSIVGVTQAMKEQATAAEQINVAVDNMRLQSEQTAKAMKEQARGIKDMSLVLQDVAQKISLISKSNIIHSQIAEELLEAIDKVGELSERNMKSIQDVREGIAVLRARSQNVNKIMENLKDKNSDG